MGMLLVGAVVVGLAISGAVALIRRFSRQSGAMSFLIVLGILAMAVMALAGLAAVGCAATALSH
jgi:hypothetical protein